MQTSLFLLFGFLFAVSLGMVIIPRILVISHKKRLYDVPDVRKVHTMPVPRLGGLSFFPVILMSMFLVIGFRLYFWDVNVSGLSFNMLYEYLFLFVGMTLLYLVGVCDDLVGVGYRYKFAVQIAAAFLLELVRLVWWLVRYLLGAGLGRGAVHGVYRGIYNKCH